MEFLRRPRSAPAQALQASSGAPAAGPSTPAQAPSQKPEAKGNKLTGEKKAYEVTKLADEVWWVLKRRLAAEAQRQGRF
jgi:hypothetical protein